jgi:hypothetical protein
MLMPLREILERKSVKLPPQKKSVIDWLQDDGIVVNTLKTEPTYFSKHD